MSYIGDHRTGVTIRHMWNSNAVAGESITRATDGTISVYKDGNTTQSTAGVTDSENFDGLTGVHLVAIDTSADGTFYSAGSDFHVVLSAATIDGKTINAFLFSFSLENRSALMPTTAGRKLDVSAGGEAGVDWANIGSPTTAQNLSGTNFDTDQVVASVTGAVGSVTGNVGGNVTGSVGSLAAQAKADVNAEVDTAIVDARLDELLAADSDIDGAAPPTVGSVFHELMSKTAGSFTFDQTTDSLEAIRDKEADIEADTQDLQTQIGAAGAGLSAIPWNAAWDAEVQSEAADALNAYDPPTHAELTSGLAGLNDLSATEVEDAVWDAALADHQDAGSTGEALDNAGSAGDPWATALPGAYGAGTAGKIVGDNLNATVGSRATQASVDTIDDFLDTEVAAIKAKTDQLVFTTANRVDSTVVDKTGFSLSAAGVQAIWDALTAALTTAGSIGKLLVDNINATISSRASQASVDTVDDFLDTEMAATLAAVDTEVAAIKAKTDLIPASPAATSDIPTANANADALLDRAAGVETGWTPRQALRLILASQIGKLSGAATTTIRVRDPGDSKDRIVATVDADGNRTAMTTDAT